MGLYEDVKKIFLELLGEDAIKVLDAFENPKLYPKEFLDQCKYFLSEIVGENIAKEKLKPLYKKYKSLILGKKIEKLIFPMRKLKEGELSGRTKKHLGNISKLFVLAWNFSRFQ